MPTSLTFDRTKQRALPIWLPIVVALLIVARIVSWKVPVKTDVDLIQWMDIDQAAAASTRSHRPILYEFSAEWCGPCHLLEREVFMDPDLAAKINNRYIAVKVVDRQREDGRNSDNVQRLIDRYSVNAFPTVVIATRDGSVRDRTVGYPGRDRFAAFLDRVR
ncbi:MAG TPA: thioredoxin family protein [Thermoanaerobaculia bacterium]